MNHSMNTPSLLSMIAVSVMILLTGCGNSSDEPTGPGAENLIKGKAFLQENGAKPGIITLKSGVQYKIITQGTGRTPRLTDEVVMHYTASHIDGTMFYDSRKENNTHKMIVKFTIPGWKKILLNMPVGSTWVLYVPPHMAYSSRGQEGFIEPNETVIFEIELLEIVW